MSRADHHVLESGVYDYYRRQAEEKSDVL